MRRLGKVIEIGLRVLRGASFSLSRRIFLKNGGIYALLRRANAIHEGDQGIKGATDKC
jgi:hypothetical protein